MSQQKSFGKTIIHLGSGGAKKGPSEPVDAAPEKEAGDRKSDRPPEGNLLVTRRVSLNPGPKGPELKGPETRPHAGGAFGRTLMGVATARPAETQPTGTGTQPTGTRSAEAIPLETTPVATVRDSNPSMGSGHSPIAASRAGASERKSDPPAHERAPVRRRVFGQTILSGSDSGPAPSANTSSPPTQQSHQMRENPKALFSSTVQGGTAPVFLQSQGPQLISEKSDDDRPVASVRLAASVKQELSQLNSAIASSRAPGTQQGSRPPLKPESETPEGQSPASALPRVGRYEVLARLKRGGMGSVYLCRISGSAGFQRLFAMKVLSPSTRSDEAFDAMEAFFGEAKLLSQLHHPNIVGIVDIGTATEPYLVLDYVEGGTLEELCRRSPTRRDPKKVVTIILDALAGLDAAHRAVDAAGNPLGLIHCDLTPHNLLVGTDGACRIADFGIARARSDADSKVGAPLWGKPGYMAPERVLGKAVDQRSDIFSLGVALYAALTGVEPFVGSSTSETLRNVVDKAVDPPSQVGLCPPPALDWVCMTALDKDPAARFQSADEMLSQLRRVVARQEFFASPSEVATWVNEAVGEKVEERRQLVRRAADPNAAGQSEAPPPAEMFGSQSAAGSKSKKKDDVAPPPPSSRTKWEATIMLSAEEQAAAAQGLSDADLSTPSSRLHPSAPPTFIPPRATTNKKVMYGAITAAVLILIFGLAFPKKLGSLFVLSPEPTASPTQPVKIDVNSANPNPKAPQTSKPNDSTAKDDSAASDDAAAEDDSHITLPRIKSAGEE